MALNAHKFRIGQTVYFTAKPLGHMASNGTYQIVKLLPSDGDEHQYRIKSSDEAFERLGCGINRVAELRKLMCVQRHL